ncbi:MAG: hypothetical protein ABFR47_08935 [Verrucomicrobiota bacterium]
MARKQFIEVKDLDRWGACCRGDGQTFSNAVLDTLLRGRARLTTLEVSYLTRRGVSAADLVWLLLRYPILTKNEIRGLYERWQSRVNAARRRQQLRPINFAITFRHSTGRVQVTTTIVVAVAAMETSMVVGTLMAPAAVLPPATVMLADIRKVLKNADRSSRG